MQTPSRAVERQGRMAGRREGESMRGKRGKEHYRETRVRIGGRQRRGGKVWRGQEGG